VGGQLTPLTPCFRGLCGKLWEWEPGQGLVHGARDHSLSVLGNRGAWFRVF